MPTSRLVIQNVETLANLPLIVGDGAEAYLHSRDRYLAWNEAVYRDRFPGFCAYGS